MRSEERSEVGRRHRRREEVTIWEPTSWESRIEGTKFKVMFSPVCWITWSLEPPTSCRFSHRQTTRPPTSPCTPVSLHPDQMHTRQQILNSRPTMLARAFIMTMWSSSTDGVCLLIVNTFSQT